MIVRILGEGQFRLDEAAYSAAQRHRRPDPGRRGRRRRRRLPGRPDASSSTTSCARARRSPPTSSRAPTPSCRDPTRRSRRRASCSLPRASSPTGRGPASRESPPCPRRLRELPAPPALAAEGGVPAGAARRLPARPRSHRVLPDGSIDLLWSHGTRLLAGGQTRRPSGATAPAIARWASGSGPAGAGVLGRGLRMRCAISRSRDRGLGPGGGSPRRCCRGARRPQELGGLLLDWLPEGCREPRPPARWCPPRSLGARDRAAGLRSTGWERGCATSPRLHREGGARLKRLARVVRLQRELFLAGIRPEARRDRGGVRDRLCRPVPRSRLPPGRVRRRSPPRSRFLKTPGPPAGRWPRPEARRGRDE